MSLALAKWKFTRIDAIGTAIVVAGAVLFYFSGVQPILNLRENYALRQSQLQDQDKNAALMASRVNEAKKKLADVKAALGACNVQLEGAESVNSRLGRLNEFARSLGLRVEEIQPSEATYYRDFGTVPIRLNGCGGYLAWTTFLHELSKSFPDTSVDGFELKGKPETPGTALDFRINLMWFVAPMPTAAKT